VLGLNLNKKRTIILFFALIIIFCINYQIFAQEIIITEIMSSNQETIQDNDFDYND
jgi:hypothetical protein